MKTRCNMPMIIGRIPKNEKKVKINLEIYCTNCEKKVPGGIKTGERYSQTKAFKTELESFKKKYLCGVCRDKKRLEN
ncbi:MAG: hypothetical protein ACE5GR_01740 [Nitrosopumilus sp.]